MVKKVLIGLVLCMVIFGGVLVYSMNNNVDKDKELTSSQIEKMIELGIIQVYPELPENEKDKEIGLIYQTQYGDCSLYRDIFGRYYCRW